MVCHSATVNKQVSYIQGGPKSEGTSMAHVFQALKPQKQKKTDRKIIK